MATQEIFRYMTVGAFATTCDQSLGAARDAMIKHNVQHLPVLQGGSIVGIVSARDLHFLDRLPGVKDALTVETAMTPEPYVVEPEADVATVAREMARRHIGSAVVAEHGAVIGIFTTIDALKVLASVMSGGEAEGAA